MYFTQSVCILCRSVAHWKSENTTILSPEVRVPEMQQWGALLFQQGCSSLKCCVFFASPPVPFQSLLCRSEFKHCLRKAGTYLGAMGLALSVMLASCINLCVWRRDLTIPYERFITEELLFFSKCSNFNIIKQWCVSSWFPPSVSLVRNKCSLGVWFLF